MMAHAVETYKISRSTPLKIILRQKPGLIITTIEEHQSSKLGFKFTESDGYVLYPP